MRLDGGEMSIRLADEVKAALVGGGPVVALESSVTAQGLPRPENLENAMRCEAVVRESGAVPATTAVLDGQLCAGVTDVELRRLAEEQGLMKIASRDFAIAAARRASGGTTVSATCEIAARAGIRVFATGGIGGVHRGVEQHLDISQDLWALSRFPVAVVCAGAKSVLDLPKTLEALEALAVPVIGIGTDEFPSFYSRTSGLELEHVAQNAEDAAAIVRARIELGQGGVLIALPPPAQTALPSNEIERHIADALDAAREQKVIGKAVTPFLLGQLAKRTEGRSLRANLALLENNARFAGQLAVALSRQTA